MNTTHLIVAIFLLPTLLFGQKPELGIPVGHSDVIQAVALSSDGSYALSGSRDKTVKLWETKSGKLIRTWHPHKNINGPALIMSVAFASIQKKQYALAASVGGIHPVLMWDLETGELAQTFTEKDTLDNLSEPSALKLSVSADGKFVMAITHVGENHRTEAKGVKIWRIQNGNLVHSFPIQATEVESICFTENNKHIWLGMSDGSIAQWKPKGMEPEQVFSVHNSPVKAIMVREDGMIVSASKNKAVVLNPIDSSLVMEKEIADAVLKGNSISISPNGQTIFYETDSIKIDRSSGQPNLIQYQMKSIRIDSAYSKIMSGHSQTINASCFSADGRLALSGSHDRTLILWDMEKGKKISQFGGFSKMLSEVVFSPDKKRLCMLPRFSKEFKVWNLEKGNEFSVLKDHKSEITTVSFLQNSTQVLFGSEDKILRLWDQEKDSVVFEFPKSTSIITAISVSPNGKQVFSGGEDGSITLWDLDKKTKIKSFQSHGRPIDALSWSADGALALSGSTNGLVRIWDMKTRAKKKEIKLNGNHWAPVAFAPDGKSFLNFSCEKFSLQSWNIENKEVEMNYSLDEIPCGSTSDICYAPDGESFLLSSGNDVFYWKTGSEQPTKKMVGHSEWVNSVNLSSDGSFGISGGYDGQVNIWELTTELETPLASIIMLNNSDWVIHTSSGLFDSSPGGFDLLYFLVDMELIDLDQLKERYWEPGLLPILLGLKGGSVREVEHLDLLPQYPEVEPIIVDDEKKIIKVNLKKRTGGIGRVSLYVNQKEVNPDINPKRVKHINIELIDYFEYFPKGEESTIGIRVYNEEGWLRSPIHEIKYMPTPIASSKGGDDNEEEAVFDDDPFYQPQLRAIIVGTSDYSGDNMDLFFADEDARMITKALKEAGKFLFKSGIHINSFYSNSTNETEVPSKQNIQGAFEKMAQEAHPKDVLFLFFSGHGMTIGEDFFYLTKDISSMKNLEKDKERQEKYAISSAEMMEWIRKIKANKQILVLDACHSGKAAELLSMGRSISSTQARALEQLKDHMGMYVLASSEANQKSFETEELGQGLLTYTMLLGMKGGALSNQESGKNKTLDVLNLLNYATNNVPDFAKGIVQKTQQPVLIIPKTSNSFPIGIINDQVNIPIPPKKSVIVNSVFMEEKQFNDPVELSTQLDEVIQANTKPGGGNDKIFLNVKSYPDSYSIRGLYNISGENISVKWRLFNGENAKGPFETTGTKGNPEKLASDILTKAFQVW